MSALTVTCTRLSPIFSWAPAGQVASPKSVAKTLWTGSIPLELFFAGPNSPSGLLEYRFLSLVQAAKSYHRERVW